MVDDFIATGCLECFFIRFFPFLTQFLLFFFFNSYTKSTPFGRLFPYQHTPSLLSGKNAGKKKNEIIFTK